MTHFTNLIQEMLELNKLQLLVSLDTKIIEQLRTMEIRRIDKYPNPKMKDILLNVSFSIPTLRHSITVELFKFGNTYTVNKNPVHLGDLFNEFFEGIDDFTYESELLALKNFLEKVVISIWETLHPCEIKSKEGN